jgi:ABC-type antimicrobial peptide transport system permease subunit
MISPFCSYRCLLLYFLPGNDYTGKHGPPQAFFALLALLAVLRRFFAQRGADGQATETLEEVASAAVAQRRFQAAVLLLFAGVALALALVGVYGVISYAVAQRTPEIGLRLALGAHRQNILGLTLARALRPILAGLVIGLAGALAASRLSTSLLFEVKPSDPATFAFVTVLLAVVALGACLIPARRATRVDPMAALRYE